MVILGVDFGDRRTGLAVSDSSEFLSSGLCTVTAEGRRALAEKIAGIARERGCEKIVMGLPLNMDGSAGERAKRVRIFGGILSEVTGLSVEYMDERCTTVQAHEYLNSSNRRGKKRKNVIDTLSAQIILQDYLDNRKNTKNNT